MPIFIQCLSPFNGVAGDNTGRAVQSCIYCWENWAMAPLLDLSNNFGDAPHSPLGDDILEKMSRDLGVRSRYTFS